MIRPTLAIIPAHPRAAVDRRLRALAKTRGWCLTVGAVPAKGPVVIVNARVPAAALATIPAVFRLLAIQDIAIAPTEDGFYWLVGLARRRAAKRRRWPAALDDLLPLLPVTNLKIELLALEDAAPLRLTALL